MLNISALLNSTDCGRQIVCKVNIFDLRSNGAVQKPTILKPIHRKQKFQLLRFGKKSEKIERKGDVIDAVIKMERVRSTYSTLV